MSEKFTHGPWCAVFPGEDDPYGNIEIRISKYRVIAKLWLDDAPVFDFNSEQKANADLIAAAPDLYAALKDLYYIVYEASDSDLVLEMGMRIQQVAKDALRKARGEA